MGGTSSSAAMVAEQAADLVLAHMICMWFVKNIPS
jgi:hypothetical protein